MSETKAGILLMLLIAIIIATLISGCSFSRKTVTSDKYYESGALQEHTIEVTTTEGYVPSEGKTFTLLDF